MQKNCDGPASGTGSRKNSGYKVTRRRTVVGKGQKLVSAYLSSLEPQSYSDIEAYAIKEGQLVPELRKRSYSGRVYQTSMVIDVTRKIYLYLSFVWCRVLFLSSFTVGVDLSKSTTCLHFHTLIYSKYCCDIGQIDRFSIIELFPLSSCQVIILIARMTFNCSTSCLMS